MLTDPRSSKEENYISRPRNELDPMKMGRATTGTKSSAIYPPPTASMADPVVAGLPILFGLVFIGIITALVVYFPAKSSSVAIGIMTSACMCYVMIKSMPRAMQISLMGAAIGVSADGAYAGFTDQTPVTIANALVKLANGIGQGVGLIAANAGSHIDSIIPVGVWSFIGATVVFTGASFLIEHDG